MNKCHSFCSDDEQEEEDDDDDVTDDDDDDEREEENDEKEEDERVIGSGSEDEESSSGLESDEDSGPDLARGKGNIETSSDEDDEDDIDTLLRKEEEEIEHDWGELCKDAPRNEAVRPCLQSGPGVMLAPTNTKLMFVCVRFLLDLPSATWTGTESRPGICWHFLTHSYLQEVLFFLSR